MVPSASFKSFRKVWAKPLLRSCSSSAATPDFFSFLAGTSALLFWLCFIHGGMSLPDVLTRKVLFLGLASSCGSDPFPSATGGGDEKVDSSDAVGVTTFAVGSVVIAGSRSGVVGMLTASSILVVMVISSLTPTRWVSPLSSGNGVTTGGCCCCVASIVVERKSLVSGVVGAVTPTVSAIAVIYLSMGLSSPARLFSNLRHQKYHSRTSQDRAHSDPLKSSKYIRCGRDVRDLTIQSVENKLTSPFKFCCM